GAVADADGEREDQARHRAHRGGRRFGPTDHRRAVLAARAPARRRSALRALRELDADGAGDAGAAEAAVAAGILGQVLLVVVLGVVELGRGDDLGGDGAVAGALELFGVGLA